MKTCERMTSADVYQHAINNGWDKEKIRLNKKHVPVLVEVKHGNKWCIYLGQKENSDAFDIFKKSIACLSKQTVVSLLHKAELDVISADSRIQSAKDNLDSATKDFSEYVKLTRIISEELLNRDNEEVTINSIIELCRTGK